MNTKKFLYVCIMEKLSKHLKSAICRTCLISNNEMISLFDEISTEDGKKPISFILETCTLLQVSKEDKLPHYICKECTFQLEKSFLFRLKCYESFKKLIDVQESNDIECLTQCKPKQLVENNDFITSDDECLKIKDVDISHDSDTFYLNDQLHKEDQCEIPCKLFPNKNQLRSNDEHVNFNKPGCNICGKHFTRYSSVKRHMTAHTGLKPYSCPFCYRSFTQSGTLSLHLQKHDEYRSGKKDKVSKEKTNLYLCPICGKYFKQSFSLTIHIRRHSGEKPYSCLVCNKRFVSKSLLASHSHMHSGKQPYSCKICNKSFSYSASLSKHMKTHINMKVYSCDYCSKTFSSSYYRKIHIRKHTGEKPLKCNTCQKSFSDPKNFKQHKLIHTESKPFLCISCGKSFRRKHHLTVHMKTHARN